MSRTGPGRFDPSRLGLAAAFATIYILWGSAFLALRFVVADVPPFLTIAVRCAAAAAILYAWCAARGELARSTPPQRRLAAASGVLLFFGCDGLLAWAEQRVPSGQAALLMALIPFWLVLLDAIVRRRPPPGRVLAGLTTGVLGIAVLTHGDIAWSSARSGTSLEHGALLLAGLAWAAGSMLIRHGDRPGSAVQSIAMQLGFAAAAAGLASLARGELSGWDPSQVTPRAVAALLFLVLCVNILTFAAYTWLLRVASPSAVGTFAFVNPIVAVTLAWAVGDEAVSIRTGVATALVVAAVVLIRRASRSRIAEGADPEPQGLEPCKLETC